MVLFESSHQFIIPYFFSLHLNNHIDYLPQSTLTRALAINLTAWDLD